MKLYAFIALSLLLALSGCAARRIPVPVDNAPFVLEIETVRNDGTELHVFGVATAVTDLPAATVAVRLTGYHDGSPVREARRLLGDITAQPLEEQLIAGTPVLFHISVPVDELTDYQLSLLWGREAEQLPRLEIRNRALVREGECSDCPPVLEADLCNPGKVAVTSAELEMQVDSSVKNREHVALPELNLPPGECRAARFVFDGEAPTGSEPPAVRVVTIQ